MTRPGGHGSAPACGASGCCRARFALVVLALLAGLAQNVAANLEARQIKSGFGFLRDPAGFNIGELLFEYSARDSYLRAFAVGMANTLRVSVAGIVLASVLGVIVGLMRLSHHGLVAWLGSAYVEVFPQHAAADPAAHDLSPGDRVAARFLGGALDRGRRAAVQAGAADRGARLGHARAAGRGRAGLLAGAAAFVAARRWLMVGAGPVGWGAGLASALLAWLAFGAIGGWSRPEVDGFLISGGASLTPEFLALWLGLSLFTSASIAELVRAGALAVPVGQWNAALALGLTRGKAIAGVIFPQALRLAIPPLASQYMNLIKNSSLAVVIGYPDLVSIGNTSINQNGQALEVIVIIMAVYLSLNLVVAVAMGAVNARVTRAPR